MRRWMATPAEDCRRSPELTRRSCVIGSVGCAIRTFVSPGRRKPRPKNLVPLPHPLRRFRARAARAAVLVVVGRGLPQRMRRPNQNTQGQSRRQKRFMPVLFLSLPVLFRLATMRVNDRFPTLFPLLVVVYVRDARRERQLLLRAFRRCAVRRLRQIASTKSNARRATATTTNTQLNEAAHGGSSSGDRS